MITTADFSSITDTVNPNAVYIAREAIPINFRASYPNIHVSPGLDNSVKILPLHIFFCYFSTHRSDQLSILCSSIMKGDFVNINSRVTRPSARLVKALSDEQLQRIERAIHRIFTELKGVPLNQIVVTDQSIRQIVPALIPDSPFVSLRSINHCILSLPFQILECFCRTIIDYLVSLCLSTYGSIDPDMAEYYKARLSITHNNAHRAVLGNCFLWW